MLDFGYCLGRKDIVRRSIMLCRCLVGRMSHHAVGGVKIDMETLAGVCVRIAQLVERRVFQAMCIKETCKGIGDRVRLNV